MTKLVVDSSVAIKWFITEQYSGEARKILADYQTGAVNFLGPDLINAEIGNIVWKKHRFYGLSAIDAQTVIDEFRKIPFVFTSSGELLDDAYKLAVAHQRTMYDALYIALSLREQCQFVTADEKLANAIGAAFPSVVWLANWP